MNGVVVLGMATLRDPHVLAFDIYRCVSMLEVIDLESKKLELPKKVSEKGYI